MSIANIFLALDTTGIVLISLAGGMILGLGLFFLIIKFQRRNKNKKVKINSKASDYQFQFKLNTGQFINNLKNMNDDKTE